MGRSGLTAKQRQALQCVQGARSAGMTLSGYARSRDLPVRQVHDALRPLRKKGLLPLAGASAKSPFIAVRVVPDARARRVAAVPLTVPSSAFPLVCRIVHGAGFVVECAEWPPTAWLAELSAGGADAAS